MKTWYCQGRTGRHGSNAPDLALLAFIIRWIVSNSVRIDAAAIWWSLVKRANNI